MLFVTIFRPKMSFLQRLVIRPCAGLINTSSSFINSTNIGLNTGIYQTRGYLKNFTERGTAVKPRAGWMSKKVPAMSHRSTYRVRIEYPKPSEVKRYRKESFNALMKSEGGRRMLMQRILKRDNRVLASPF